MSTQKITPNIPAVKIMNPILRILLILACNPLIPANNPVKENSIQYKVVEIGMIVLLSTPMPQKTKGSVTKEKLSSPIKPTNNLRCFTLVTIKKYHRKIRIKQEVAYKQSKVSSTYIISFFVISYILLHEVYFGYY